MTPTTKALGYGDLATALKGSDSAAAKKLADFTAQTLADLTTLGTSAAAQQSPVVDEWTNAAAPSTTALKAATATTVAPQTISSFVAGGVAALAAYGRNLTFTTAGSTATHAPNTAVVTGTRLGAAQTETVTGLAGGAATYSGVKAFDTVTSVVYGAAGGTDATVAIGVGQVFGLARPIKSRAGLPHVYQEIAVGVVVTTGTIVSAAGSAPNGSYSPSAAPDGAKDFALSYEPA